MPRRVPEVLAGIARYLVRWISCRAWLATQTHCSKITNDVHARRNPPNVMNFDMVDYDARKGFTYLKAGRFARLIHPTVLR